MGTNNYRYILVDGKGSEFEIKPEDLLFQKELHSDIYAFDENLTLDANVHLFNAHFNSNKELLENLIHLYNENHLPLNPDDYMCVKLISKEMVNSYGLPIYYSGSEENKGNLLVPIIYKSDLDQADFVSNSSSNENAFYDSDLIEPDALTFFEKIPAPEYLNNNIFYNNEYNYLLNCFKKKFNTIYAAERNQGREVRLQDINGKFIPYNGADISNILFNTVSVEPQSAIKKGKVEQAVFSKYFPRGSFFYRLMLDVMIMSKRVYLVNNGKCTFDQVFSSPRITERNFIYSKDEIKKLNQQDEMYKDQERVLSDVFDDVYNATINTKTDEENLQDFINRVNANFDGVRPSYIPKETEEDMLPFRYKEVEEDKTPEDYYSIEDYYFNNEIRKAIELGDDDSSSYSDFDERHDRNR